LLIGAHLEDEQWPTGHKQNDAILRRHSYATTGNPVSGCCAANAKARSVMPRISNEVSNAAVQYWTDARRGFRHASLLI
jgi:hypothetical protein